MRKLIFGLLATAIVAGSIFYACQKNETAPQKEDITSVKQQKLPSGYFETTVRYIMKKGFTECFRETIEELKDWNTHNVIVRTDYKLEVVDCNSISLRAEVMDLQLTLKDGIPFRNDDDSDGIIWEGIIGNLDNYIVKVKSGTEWILLTPDFSKTIVLDDGTSFVVDYDYILTSWNNFVENME